MESTKDEQITPRTPFDSMSMDGSTISIAEQLALKVTRLEHLLEDKDATIDALYALLNAGNFHFSMFHN